MRTLCEILARYDTDKNTTHSYGPVYEELFAPFRKSARVILEIGVFKGASLRTWQDYFPNAVVFGVDCDPSREFRDFRIETIITDVWYSGESLQRILKALPAAPDLIIDDGPHSYPSQVSMLFALWAYLRPGGLYVIEDAIHAYTIGAMRHMPYVREYDRRAIKGCEDDILYVFQKPERHNPW